MNTNAPSKPLPKTLVVDDDQIFRNRLVRALAARGYPTIDAPDASTAIEHARTQKPARAIIDLKMPGMGGLDLINALLDVDPDLLIVVLTGYGSIATAVEAVRRGALDYLTKPADADQILGVFEKVREEDEEPNATTPSLARVEWEHIQRILFDCGGNISEAARRLGIHRRSLQRKLSKLPPFE
jgi:two-component system response regulator RegA